MIRMSCLYGGDYDIPYWIRENFPSTTYVWPPLHYVDGF